MSTITRRLLTIGLLAVWAGAVAPFGCSGCDEHRAQQIIEAAKPALRECYKQRIQALTRVLEGGRGGSLDSAKAETDRVNQCYLGVEEAVRKEMNRAGVSEEVFRNMWKEAICSESGMFTRDCEPTVKAHANN
jgi:hypothetical protein